MPSTVTGLVELVRRECERAPEAVALVDGSDHLTFRALADQTRRLARDLREAGAGPEAVVATCVEPSSEMVIALLAVFEAGAACLPLDPSHPPTRLRFLLHDVGASLLLGDPEQLARLDLGHERMVDVRPGDRAAGAAAPAIGPDHLAYIVYTSGSTGAPKAVGLPYRALENLFHWYRDTLAPGLRTMQLAPFSFDVSLHEVLASLASGGTLHVYRRGLRVAPREVARFVHQRGIQRMVVTPALLHALASIHDVTALLGSLTEVVSTGEQLDLTPAVVRMFSRLPGVRLANHFGPTECEGGTFLALPGKAPSWPAHAPLGDPVRSTSLLVLDDDLRPVAPGEAGEAYFAGAGMARGYLGQPARTAASFVPNPWSDAPGGLMYRTGDVVRFDEAGDLWFLGRRDHQVKIAGFRVELGEIEAALRQIPSVEAAVVLALGSGPVDRRLVAYVVEAGRRRSEATMRRHLMRRLPRHMVPVRIINLGSFPLTPSGKVNRAALASVEGARDAPQAPLGTPDERAVARIWAEVLQVPLMDPQDDFFQRGGDSIRAMQAVARTEETFGLRIPPSHLFDWPTVREFLEHLPIP